MEDTIAIHGWIDIEPRQAATLANALAVEHARAALAAGEGGTAGAAGGWCWSPLESGSHKYLFYGNHGDAGNLRAFETLLNTITALNLQAEGYFHAHGSEVSVAYRLHNGHLSIEQKAEPLIGAPRKKAR